MSETMFKLLAGCRNGPRIDEVVDSVLRTHLRSCNLISDLES